MFTVPLIPVCL